MGYASPFYQTATKKSIVFLENNLKEGDSIVTRIRELAKKQNISISKIERACDLGNGTIRKWDDHTPTLDRVKKVADLLGVSIAELEGEEKK